METLQHKWDEQASAVPFISVIVPFYNIEDRVANCLGSLLVQDYGSYEVVCVDDGSTDATGAILDACASMDERIRVIHINHSGLSEARNTGVRSARGELVSFVDGDDVVSPHYLQLLHEAHGGAAGRMVIGSWLWVEDDGIRSISWPESSDGQFVAHSGDEALREYLLWRIGLVAWGRLAERELYLRFPFEPGVLYEDSYAAPSHLSAVRDVVVVKASVYAHVTRLGSITRPLEVTRQHLDGKVLSVVHLDAVAARWPSALTRLSYWRRNRHLLGLVLLARSLPDKRVARHYLTWAQLELRKGLRASWSICHEERLTWTFPIACSVAAVSTSAFCAMFRAYGKLCSLRNRLR